MAGVGIVTVRQLEGGVNEPRRATLEVVRRALESAGVEFIDVSGDRQNWTGGDRQNCTTSA